MFDEFFLDVLNRRDCTYEYFDEKEAVYKFAKFDSGKMIADFMITSLSGEILFSDHLFVSEMVLNIYYTNLISKGYALSYSQTYNNVEF